MNTKPQERHSDKRDHSRPAKGTDKQGQERSTEDALDEALEQSFPASDPPAQTEPTTHVGAKKKHEKKPD